eukprot:6201440-Pleurochrysis_carterae.AAC.3
MPLVGRCPAATLAAELVLRCALVLLAALQRSAGLPRLLAEKFASQLRLSFVVSRPFAGLLLPCENVALLPSLPSSPSPSLLLSIPPSLPPLLARSLTGSLPRSLFRTHPASHSHSLDCCAHQRSSERTRTRAHTHAHTQSYTHAYSHAYSPLRAFPHMRTRVHARTCTRIHAYSRTSPPACI